MKKLALILAMLLMFTSACAEGFDFASMDDATLQAIIDGAKAELDNRNGSETDNSILLDQDGVKMYLTGNHEVWGSDNYYLDLEVIVENNSDRGICIDFDSVTINGWEVYGSGIYNTGSGKKQKGMLEFKLTDASISTYEEVEEMEMIFYMFDDESYETIKTFDPITLTF